MNPRILALCLPLCAWATDRDCHVVKLKDGRTFEGTGLMERDGFIYVTRYVKPTIVWYHARTIDVAQAYIDKRPVAQFPYLEETGAPVTTQQATDEKEITKTILDVSTDQFALLNKRIRIHNAVLTLSTYYNYGYGDARNTHLSFGATDESIRGAGNRAYFYADRTWDGADVLKQQALKDGYLVGDFVIQLTEDRYRDSGQLLAEILSFSIHAKR